MAMEQLVEMYNEIEDNHSWNSVYQEIDKQSSKQERKLKLTTKVAHSWENADRNRFRNVLAYDTSRVVLKRENSERSDYINASRLVVPSAKRNYILTQGPLSTTSNDFWQMVWEQNSTLIIMLNKLVEKGLSNPKREFDSFDVVLKEEQNFDDYVIRDLELLQKTGDVLLEKNGHNGLFPRIVKHFHFTSWPDFGACLGVPHSTAVFIGFLQKVRGTGLLFEKEPTVVHCSAGIGRSGTFVVVDSVLSMVEQNVKKIDVTNLVVEMRRSRMGLIQTPQQLQFCWKTIADAVRQGVISKNMKCDTKSVSDKFGRNLLAVPISHINGEANEMPHLERSQANQMTTDLHSKSCSDLSALRKRASTDSYEMDKETKHAKRKKRIEGMRARLLKCDGAGKKWHHMAIGRTGGRDCFKGSCRFGSTLMFGTSNTFGSRPNSIFSSGTANASQNPLNDIEVPSPPDDTVEALKFNPQIAGQPVLLVSGSWDSVVRVWQISESGQCEAKAQQTVGGPVLDLDWLDDGTKIFVASADKQVRVWDLASNQMAVVGTHDEPVRKCHWIKAPNYTCLMTGSWDKTLRFWDMRQLPTQTSLATVQLGERVYCSDVLFPMGIVGLANRRMKVYRLDNEPSEVKDIETPLKYQSRCASIFKDKTTGLPTGYALGSIEGRVAIQYVEAANPKDNFTFKCHRSPELINGFQEIYAVNDIAFHPSYGTLATVGSDGRISFWDKDARTKLKTSDPLPAPITRCVIHHSGQMMAYAIGYDWSKGHEGYNPQVAGSKIFLHACDEDMKPKQKK